MRRKFIMLAVPLIAVLAGGAGFALMRGLPSKTSAAPAATSVRQSFSMLIPASMRIRRRRRGRRSAGQRA